MNDRPVGLLAVYQSPGADALSTARGVIAALNSAKRQFPPGVDYVVPYDTTPPITASIDEILLTLAMAIVLVVLVVYVFLQSWRATLIPLVTVPVALIGTFIFFPLFGFSINVLTMFGLVLAIGIVGDDAIVVTEAVMGHMEQGMDRRAATVQAKLRFRPILMTSFAFIFGTLPLVFATGSAANSRIALGTAVVFGMSVATGLGVFLIPSFYTMIARRGASQAPAAAAGSGVPR